MVLQVAEVAAAREMDRLVVMVQSAAGAMVERRVAVTAQAGAKGRREMAWKGRGAEEVGSHCRHARGCSAEPPCSS